MKKIDKRLDALYGLACQAIEYHARDVNEPNDAHFKSMMDDIRARMQLIIVQDADLVAIETRDRLKRTRRALADLGLIEYPSDAA